MESLPRRIDSKAKTLKSWVNAPIRIEVIAMREVQVWPTGWWPGFFLLELKGLGQVIE